MARAARGPKKARTLTEELATLLEKTFVPDLTARARQPQVEVALRSRYDAEKARSRTAAPFDEWVEHTVEQVGAAWILSCVFVRTLEDRGYLERRRLGGEGALDSQQQFFEIAPSLTERDYVLTVFRELATYPGIAEVLGPAHNPAWRLSPSNDSVRALLALLRESEGDGLRFRFEGSDTRFLGDLYQDVSEVVRDRFALLQTPDFVERFILDQTLEPAITEFGLEQVRVIDPTCGSGHFLLGAFRRLFEHRVQAQPGVDRREHAAQALAQVYGVDLNPYAVAIARFRLTLAYFEHAAIHKLSQAPRVATNLLVADSLLHGGSNRRLSEAATDKAAWGDRRFEFDDEVAAARVWAQRYHAIVGNPPYITCKDAALRELYRDRYESASGKYALAAPFTERFFELAVDGGFVGLINANSFMKREFGKALIEKVLRRLDLTDVIDSSGAYIPGHGTPTVILFGRNRKPVTSTVRAVLGKRAEPATPNNPEEGYVWSSLVAHHTEIGFENDYLSVADVTREVFDKHPWSLGGGGAAELKELLEERSGKRLNDVVEEIGFASFSGLDDLFILPLGTAQRWGLGDELVRPLVSGEDVRDWSYETANEAVAAYDKGTHLALSLLHGSALHVALWPFQSVAESIISFGGKTRKEHGENWWQWYRWQSERYVAPMRIAYAEVSTHNHFAIDRGGRVFNRTAPIIRLRLGANEDDHLALLGYLNSSTACFWMKQVCHQKSSAGQKHHPDPARFAYAFSGTALQEIPIPELSDRLRRLAHAADDLSTQRWQILSLKGLRRVIESTSISIDSALAGRWLDADALRARLIFLQEEMDWTIYLLLGLARDSDGLLVPEDKWREARIDRGKRAFEIVHGRSSTVRAGGQAVDGELDDRDSTLPSWLAEVTDRRVRALKTQREIALIESAVFKRQWRDTDKNVSESEYRQGHDNLQLEALVLESLELIIGRTSTLMTIRALESALDSLTEGECARASRDALYSVDDTRGLLNMVLRAAVPFVAGYRYSGAGGSKFRAWQWHWECHRSGNATEVPERYEQMDYAEPGYWQLRGKLDVPKERFISYPGCERDEDKSPLIGWAGWNHLERAQVLAGLFQERKEQDGWGRDRLTPILAGLLELVPWVKQWHNDPDPAYDGQRMGEVYEAFVSEKARELRLTLDDLRNWRPLPKQPKIKKPKAASTSSDTIAPKRARRRKAADDTAE